MSSLIACEEKRIKMSDPSKEFKKNIKYSQNKLKEIPVRAVIQYLITIRRGLNKPKYVLGKDKVDKS